MMGRVRTHVHRPDPETDCKICRRMADGHTIGCALWLALSGCACTPRVLEKQ